jgi:undecaprenyl-diphosphatase
LDIIKTIITIILGIIQGLTEWLPISSTGHLKIAEHFMNERIPLLFDFILHIGTLIVVLLFFRRDIKNILSALVHLDFKTEHGKLIPLIIVGSIPAGIIGIILNEPVNTAFQNTLPIAVALVLSGIMLYSAKFAQEKNDTIGYSTAILVGAAEGIAIIPGISRSGATIAVALLLGIKREKAFKFSFLLSIPAILSVLGYNFAKRPGDLASAGLGWPEILTGVIVAMFIGYFALKLLWGILGKKKFHLFAFYCWLLGTALIVLGLRGF